MFKIEDKLVCFVKKHIFVICAVVLALLSLVLRCSMRSHVSGDMNYYLVRWYDSLKQNGINATLHMPESDYNVAYLSLMKIATFLPFSRVFSIKIISIFFDYLMSAAFGWVVYLLLPKSKNSKKMAVIATLLALFLPIPILNSSVWGQCDSIYALFILLSIALLIREKYFLSFTMLALSFCFKLQAIMFLPVFVILYFVRRKFSALLVLQVPLFVFLLGLLGRNSNESIFFGFQVYGEQTQAYKYLYIYYPGIFAPFAERLLGKDDYSTFAMAGIICAFAALLIMMAYIIYHKLSVDGEGIILLSVWSVITCASFLPAMHERYGYLAELIIWIYFILKPSPRRFALAAAVNLVPIIMYCSYLFEANPFGEIELSIVNFAVYAVLTVVLIRNLKTTAKSSTLEKIDKNILAS